MAAPHVPFLFGYFQHYQLRQACLQHLYCAGLCCAGLSAGSCNDFAEPAQSFCAGPVSVRVVHLAAAPWLHYNVALNAAV
jgi:hypothetical protein